MYEFSCNQCDGESYIGETYRPWAFRLAEHERPARGLTGRSAVADHLNTVHGDRTDVFPVSARRVAHLPPRLLKSGEALCIQEMKPTHNQAIPL